VDVYLQEFYLWMEWCVLRPKRENISSWLVSSVSWRNNLIALRMSRVRNAVLRQTGFIDF
jgi:hypothetical protein